MGDLNQSLYLQKFVPSTDGPVLEVGSKDYGNTASFRSVYTNSEYVGVDLEAGPGVDVIHDLAEGVGPLTPGKFKLIVCCSVMEHCPKPWALASTLHSLLAPGGVVYISVPWVWRYHPYPDDYFRFSHRGVMSVFPEMEWSNMLYSTNVIGEFKEITSEKNGPDNKMAVFRWTLKGKRKHLPYLNVNMLGRKAA